MPHSKNTRFDLAGFMKARNKVLQENRKLAVEYKKVKRAKEKVSQCSHFTLFN